MKLPILYALTYPERLALNIERLDLATIGKLEFFPPDRVKFRCIELAYLAGNIGGTAPAVLNAANEIVVDKFFTEKNPIYPDSRDNREGFRECIYSTISKY